MKRVAGSLACLVLLAVAAAAQNNWKFAVSGDSRNCGDIVMPAIAAGAARDGARFFWDLGDFRANYDFDQDFRARFTAERKRPPTISEYQNRAWGDFIQNQLGAFSIPVYLGLGNHELIAPKTRADYLIQFADWLNTPGLQQQRRRDNDPERRLRAYYHWVQGGVDFINLDNASEDQFDAAQMRWLEGVLKRDQSDPQVRAVVVGMHAVLPEAISTEHSMNDWPDGEQSGRRAYADLLAFRDATHKPVYALASHSHFYLPQVFNSEYWKTHGGVIPGWIVGTAGAARYPLPKIPNLPADARTNTYGYLLGTVDSAGVRFQFREITEVDVPAAVTTAYGTGVVHECFAGNGAK